MAVSLSVRIIHSKNGAGFLLPKWLTGSHGLGKRCVSRYAYSFFYCWHWYRPMNAFRWWSAGKICYIGELCIAFIYFIYIYIYIYIYILACNLKNVTHIYSILSLYVNAGRKENPWADNGRYQDSLERFSCRSELWPVLFIIYAFRRH